MMNDNDFMEYLREKEAEYLPNPPEGLWDDIERSLPTKRHHIVPMWLRYAGVAACMALVFGIGMLFDNGSSERKGGFVAQDKETFKIRKYDSPVISNDVTSKISSRHQAVASPAVQDEAISSPQEETHDIREVEQKQGEHAPSSKNEHRHNHWLADNSYKRKGNRGVAFSLFAGNVMSSNRYSQNSFFLSSTFPSDMEMEESPVGEIIDLNEGVDMDTKKHYNLPLRAGVRVSLPITDRISVESGLTYTQLSSSMESGSDENYYLTEQKLHYIGIPLKLRYQLWSGKRISVYASGGGMVEKCVSGKAETHYVIKGKATSSELLTVSEKPLQLSATLSAGIEANVTSDVSLFLEPGVSYYFDNHSSMDNIYKDKPLNLDINLGVRVSLGN